MAAKETEILTDGSIEFSGGVDSLKPTTVASRDNPNGLARNQLAWLVNGTVRDGGISPRWGWQPLFQIANNTGPVTAAILAGFAAYQGGFLYEPPGAFPYMIFSIGGDIFKGDPNAGPAVNLSNLFNLHNPTNVEHAYFCQGEQFLIIQAGDGVTLPLFWDGTTLRRSLGLNPPLVAGNPPPQAPAGSTLISTDTQTFRVPLLTNTANQPTIDLTWTSVAGLVVGQFVKLQAHAQHPITKAHIQYGTYRITVLAGNVTTLAVQDSVGQFLSAKAIQIDLIQTPQPPPPSTNPPPPPIPELPAGYAMDYYMQRIWYVYGDQKTYTAGDIAGDTSSGTLGYNFTDSILKVTESPLAIGGDGFRLPSNAGNIRALFHPTNLNAALGQGQLYISTAKKIFGLTVPVSRADWIATNSANLPIQTVVQDTNGAIGDRSVVAVNGDNYYQSLEPSVRSLVNAVRYFGQPGNIPISNQENRILQFTDRSLLSFGTGTVFDNRCLQSALPKRLPQGIVHQALMPLDFEPISEFASQLPPCWEGHYEGLDFLQVFSGNYGGLERAFAAVVSRTDHTIWLWELTEGGLFENGDNRITWQVETPAWTFGKEFNLKRLVGGEFWFDRIFGTVEITVEYRTDGETCWNKWHQWKECSARNCNETIPNTCTGLTYPPQQSLGYGYRNSISLPKPPVKCDTQMVRPSDIGHQFQLRVTVHGSMRIRGIFIHGVQVERRLYSNVPC